MGAWGVSYFDNDDAGEFMGDLADKRDWTLVKRAFESVLAVSEADYLEVTESGSAIAAAAILAQKSKRFTATDFPDDVEVISSLAEPPPELASLALRALARVQAAQSELADLWEESGEKASWLATLAALEAALQ